MKGMMNNLVMKPAGLRENVEAEPFAHKARIVSCALVMAAISGTYTSYYANIITRSDQLQAKALSSRDSDWPSPFSQYSEKMWNAKNTLSVLDSMDWKTLKYIAEDWRDHSYTNKEGTITYGNPQDEYPDVGIFTQTERYNDFYQAAYGARWAAKPDVIGASAIAYEGWEKMRDVIWFDTTACLRGDHVGDINKGTISPYGGDLYMDEWIKGSFDVVTNANGEETNWTNANPDTPAPGDTLTAPFFDTDLRVPEEMLTFNDESLYRTQLEDYINMVDNCDIDCQAKGSQMTLVATLGAAAFAMIAFNALLMFFGTWMYQARMASVLCTGISCMFQFIVIVISGVCLMSPYNQYCRHSQVDTAGELMWTMRDDIRVIFHMWIGSILMMFPIVCCGLQSAYRPVGGKVSMM